jgi:hypothetical protein
MFGIYPLEGDNASSYIYLYDDLIGVRLNVVDDNTIGLYYIASFPDDMDDEDRLTKILIDDNGNYRFACQYGIFGEWYLPPEEGEAFKVGDDWYIEDLEIEDGEGVFEKFYIGWIDEE